ncbi:MAG: threonyl-tRNA synthetase editing domain-containing protein, partial [Desulfurococcaceae archaeon]
MRILAIHAKTFSYDIVKPAIEEPENINDDLKKEFENVLVLFTTIENSDDVDIVNNAIVEIDNLIKQIKPTEVLIYPYAHLSTDLASPVKAVEILNKLYDVASKSLQVPVYKAPF